MEPKINTKALQHEMKIARKNNQTIFAWVTICRRHAETLLSYDVAEKERFQNSVYGDRLGSLMYMRSAIGAWEYEKNQKKGSVQNVPDKKS